MNDLVKITWKNLKSRRLRSWLTIIGVIIGIAAIVSLFLISEGLQNSVEVQFEALGVSNIRIVPGGLTGPPGGSNRLDISLADNIERVKSVEYVDKVISSTSKVIFNKETQFITTISYDNDLGQKGFVDTDVDVSEGRLLDVGDRNVALVGWNVAKELFDKDIYAKNKIEVEGTTLKVVGVIEETGTESDNTIVLPLSTAQEILEVEDEVNVFVVKIKQGIDIEEAAEDIRDELEKELDEEEFTVFTPEQLLNQIKDILGVIQIILVGIAVISLLVGGIGIMNAMFTSVLERTKEIGIMKAIGAKNSSILTLFVIEAGLIGLVGGIVGTALGAGAAQLVGIIAELANFSGLVIIIKWPTIIFGLTFAFVVGIASGIIPAIRASKLQPVDALRYE
ncbi:ABC transporter permease [Candidatus Woesearchaeota archaeon]|nr:ABC transporter permease [Candidatus Woesearchaeota archaeon]